LCLSHVEDEFHIFFNCEVVREAWHVMELANFIHPRLQTFNNIRDFIFYMCRSGSDFNASKAAVLMWFIWQNRNNKVWNDSILSAQQIGVQALTYWNQWATINGLLQEQQQRTILCSGFSPRSDS
jgi:hypothetical protein